MSVKPEVVILSESVLASIIKDLITFMMVGGTLYFNHSVLGGNWFIDIAFILFIFMWLSTMKLSQVFKGKKSDAIKWLNKENK